MTDIKLRKVSDGWQSYRESNGKITVLDDFFMEEDRELSQAQAEKVS